MAQKGSYLLNTWHIDDANRVLRLIQDRIATLQATQNTTASSVQSVVAGTSSGGGGGSTGSPKTIFVVFTNPGGGIIINSVGRASVVPTVVLGP